MCLRPQCLRACCGFNKQIFGADKQVFGRGQSDREGFGPVSCRAGRAELYPQSALLNLPRPARIPVWSGPFPSMLLRPPWPKTCSFAPMICSLKPRRPIATDVSNTNRPFCDGHHIGGRQRAAQLARTTSVARMMMTLGTPELVLVLIALGGMTAAATWGVIELKRSRK